MIEANIEGAWREIKANAKVVFSKAISDDVDQIIGNYEALCAQVQRKEGITKTEAEEKVADYFIAQARSQCGNNVV